MSKIANYVLFIATRTATITGETGIRNEILTSCMSRERPRSSVVSLA